MTMNDLLNILPKWINEINSHYSFQPYSLLCSEIALHTRCTYSAYSDWHVSH